MNNPQAQVGIIVGSESDLPVIEPAVGELTKNGITSEVVVLSAHRNPVEVADWASSAQSRGLKVLIAGAGMAAALPGVVAAHTELPVIGVPLTSAKSPLGGVDALLATVQMPPGVPVACVAIDGAKNAAALAHRILSLVPKT